MSMTFFNWFFKSNKAQCPRCLGKGNVDSEDIKRLDKEPYWALGKCALCRGKGKVTSKIAGSGIEKLGYLTLETPNHERRRLLKGNRGAMERASQHQTNIDDMVKKIETKFFLENWNPNEIAEYLFEEYRRPEYTTEEKQELIRYVEKIIESKISKN